MSHKQKPAIPASKLISIIFVLLFAAIGVYLLTFSHAATSGLVGDINGDGTVNIYDLSLLLGSYDQTTSQCHTNSNDTCDLNGDGVVNIFDLSILLTHYGQKVSAPTVNLSASPQSISSGQSSTLTWSSTNATACTASGGWSGSQATSGTQRVSPTVTTTYSLSCTGNGSSASQSTTVSVSSSSGGATVSAAPEGPAVPTGGWTVEYADAFGSCLVQTNTSCSAGYPRSDGGWAPLTSHNGAGNPNEIASFQPVDNDITKDGLSENCVAVVNDGDNYSCGSILGNGGPAGTDSNAPSAPNPFHWSAPSGHFAMQFRAILPANQGNMDPQVWSNGPGDNPELDFPEWWGWSHIPTTSNSWCGDGWGFPAVPFDSGGSTGEADTFWCQSQGLNFDPSAAYHTYTMDINTVGSTTTMTGYIDGNQVTRQTYNNFNSAAEKLILGNDMRADNATGSRTAQTFPAGGNSLIIRYIAIYEASNNHNSGTNGPMIAPGTTVSP